MADAEGAEAEDDPMLWVRAATAAENATPVEEDAASVDGEGARDEEMPSVDGVEPRISPTPPGTPLPTPPRHRVTMEEVEDEGDHPQAAADVGEDMDDECGAPFVEGFCDARAGQPIDDSRAAPFDLRAHMASVGRFASPKDFEVAELLMTTKMTNESRDEHLKSRKVSSSLSRQVAQLLTYLLHSIRARRHGRTLVL
jgi:hypothetical protein